MAIFTRGPYPSLRLAGALLTLVIAAGCGGGLSLDPVASAANRTLDKQTGRFTLAVKLSVPELGSTTISGAGSFDAAEQSAALTMNGIGASTSSMELRMLYPVTYMRFPNLPLPTDKSWIKVDLEKAANALGMKVPQLQLGGNPSPTDALAQLRGSRDAKKLGTETIDGVNTTHYRVTIDVDKALARATPQASTTRRRTPTSGSATTASCAVSARKSAASERSP